METNQTGTAGTEPSRLGRIEIQAGQPARFVADDSIKAPDVTESQREESHKLADTLKAYRDAAEALLFEQYKELRDLVPKRLSEPGHITAVCCQDGIAVRHDRRGSEKPKVRVGFLEMSLAELAPGFSEGLVHFPADPATYAPGDSGIKLQMGSLIAPQARS